MEVSAGGEQEDSHMLRDPDARRRDHNFRAVAAVVAAAAALVLVAVARPQWSGAALHQESGVAASLAMGSSISLRSSNTGCSNWDEIIIGKSPQNSWESCEKACQLHPSGCTGFGYSTCAAEGGIGSGMCYLYTGWCEEVVSECWDLGSFTSLTQLEEYAFAAPRCMISCQGRDGIGHQIETKLTCIGAAASRGMLYVHQPIWRADHGSDPEEFEAFFGLGVLGRPLDTIWPLETKGRNAMPTDGYRRWELENYVPMMSQWCSTSDHSWCEADGHSVYQEVDCNDLFYCPEGMAGWYSVLPAIQHAYYSTPKPDSDWLAGFSGGGWGTKVAIHLRRGDTHYPVESEYYVRMLAKLRYELADPAGAVRPVFRVQTDAPKEQLLLEIPEFMADDVVIDDKYSSPLELAIHRMITADVLVMSASSLAMTAALIGNNSRVLAPCMVGRTVPVWAPILHWEKDLENCPDH